MFENLQEAMFNSNKNEMQNTTYTKTARFANLSLALPNIKIPLTKRGPVHTVPSFVLLWVNSMPFFLDDCRMYES